MNRRHFLFKSSHLSLMTFLALEGLSSSLFAQSELDTILDEKKSLQFHNRRPLNAEAHPHNLNDDITQYKDMFIRNNGLLPLDVHADTWRLEVSGESVQKAQFFSITELQKYFKEFSLEVVIECGGNGRSEYSPPAKGNQWNTGAVANVKWSGIRLKDLLQYCGIKDDAVYIGYYGHDRHLSGDVNKSAISRGCPIAKALDKDTLIAYKMNDEAIPLVHGFPLRLIVPGYPGSASGKWLHKISVRNKEHDGSKMTGYAYRVPKFPVAPGTHVDQKDMKIIEEMPVKSLITSIKSGSIVSRSKVLTISGHAWSGHGYVYKVMVSKDFGITWQEATLKPAPNKCAWHRFSYEMTFEQNGYYEVWARAIDSLGRSQPIVMLGWNPKGYLNNAAHRIALHVIS